MCIRDRYSSGPRTEPWGTPKGAGTQGDLDEPRTTQFERSVKKDLSQSRGWSTKPKEVERRYKRMEWYTLQSQRQSLRQREQGEQPDHGQLRHRSLTKVEAQFH